MIFHYQKHTVLNYWRYPGHGAARPPAAVRFRDFPPPGAVAARRVHFAPELPAEPRREPFSPGTPPGVFARPAAVLDHAAARPARSRRAPSRLDLEAWGEPCRGIIIATSHAKHKVRVPPPPRHYCACVGAPTYATRLCASLCSNGHPAIQLKYMYSTLLLALLFGCVVYASATPRDKTEVQFRLLSRLIFEIF